MSVAATTLILETPVPQMRPPTTAAAPSVEPLIHEMLQALGENPEREGLVKTPHRVDKAMRFLTSGYQMELDEVVNGAVFESSYRDMVLVRDVDVFSLCEHHLLPFFGKAHIAYLPDGKVLGLSKLPRITEMFARRLQLQENLTQQIAEAVDSLVQPRGVAVALECSHMCVAMRGVQKVGSTTVTRALLGAFRDDPRLRQELSLVEGSGQGGRLWGA